MSHQENKTRRDIHSLFQQAAHHFQQREFAQAESLAQKILAISSGHADTHHLLGLISGMRGQHDMAHQLIARAIKHAPDRPAYYLNYGLALIMVNHPSDALIAYEKAIRLDPGLPDAHYKRGNVLRILGRLNEAKAAYEQVIHLRPGYAEAHYNLGNVHYAKGNQNTAITCYKHAISLKPNFAEAYCNIGNAFNKLDHLDNALAAYDRAIQLKPDYAEAFSNRGMALVSMDRRTEALASYARAIQLKPGFAEAHNNYGLVLLSVGRLEESESSYRHALALKPDYYQAHDNLLFALNYDPGLSPEVIFKAHCEWDHRYTELLPQIQPRTGVQQTDSDRRLRVGYVSPDFRTHSVAYFLEPLLHAHYRENVEVFCYSNVQRPDSTTKRIRSKADHWLSITGMTDEAAAKRIRQDRIDILVDLAGHTANNRLLVFARRPAPVQVTWLGYPNTTGMRSMDYRITDKVADPEGDADRLHAEILVRLENGFLCYNPPEKTPGVTALPALKTGYITFGSFNNLAKVTADVIALWSEVLHAIPESRLLLKDKALIDKNTQEHHLNQFAAQGIAKNRIDLHGKLPKTEDHLQLYNRIDIALDPTHYNGTTTTCEALWMGVPVVTLEGNRHAGRVGASILACIGHTEWVATTPTAYIETAINLASEINTLKSVREALRSQVKMSPLCNSDSFAKNIEMAYRHMWELHIERNQYS